MNHLTAYLHHRDAFAELLDPRRYTIDWLDRQVAKGAFKVWGNDGAAIVTEIKHYPTGAMDIHGMCAAGALWAIRELVADAEAWAKANGCIGAEIASRPAWARVLEGYAVHQVTIRKDL